MPLNIDEVRKIAALSRLRIGAEEEQRLTLQLATIVDDVVRLSGSGGTLAGEGEAASLPERADVVAVNSGRRRLLDNAPERVRDYFVVPRVLGG